MSVTEHIRNGEGQILLWLVGAEEVPALLDRLSSRPDWCRRAESIVLDKRKKEFLIPRILLLDLCGPSADIDYTPEGRPVLKPSGSGHISISHTGACVALAFHPIHPVGVDVEQISDRILRIAPRVLSREEIASICPDRREIHTLLLWSAKESLFKAVGVPGIDFREQLHVEPFCPADSGSFQAWESKTPRQTRYVVHYKVYAGFVLTYCMQE